MSMKLVPKETYLYLKELYRTKNIRPHIMMVVSDGFGLHEENQRVCCTCEWQSEPFAIHLNEDIQKASRGHSDKTNHSYWLAH